MPQELSEVRQYLLMDWVYGLKPQKNEDSLAFLSCILSESLDSVELGIRLRPVLFIKNRFQQNRKGWIPFKHNFILILFWKKFLSILRILRKPHIRYASLSTEFLQDKTNGSYITFLLWCFQQGIFMLWSFLRVKRNNQHDFLSWLRR